MTCPNYMQGKFVEGKGLTIKLDKKSSCADGSTFYRFTMLHGKVVIWFTLHNNRHIYSIGISTENLFPISKTRLFPQCSDDEPFYFERIIIDPHTLNDDISTTRKYIIELQLACAIGQGIEHFFKHEFLRQYVISEELVG